MGMPEDLGVVDTMVAVSYTHLERLYYSTLLTGIASWGYVVVSADYLERGLAAQTLGSKVTSTPAMDTTIMQSSLSAVEQASAAPTSVLHLSLIHI